VARTRTVNLHQNEYDVYIGRAGHGLDGYFGNPIRRGPDAPRGSTLPKFEAHFLKRIDEDPEFKRRVLELKGLRLGCFCAPNSGGCHGNIYVRWLDGPIKRKGQSQLTFFG
jgi:hypothetical protein